MKRGKYIVLEGAEGVGKTTIAAMVVHELERLGVPVRSMHEPDGRADPTTREIRRLTQDPQYPMNTRTEVLLYNAARSQSLEAVRAARDSGEVVVVDRSYLTTLAVQFYGRGDIADYQQLNDIISFAVGDMWPDLTIVLDAPVDVLRQRAETRGETERFDNLGVDILERIRAGYLWEAKQRNMPLVYATGRVDEVFEDVWRHIAILLQLDHTAVSEPTALADVLSKSPAATVLAAKQAAATSRSESTYYVPASLPDNVQCDYCDGIDRLQSEHRKLVTRLSAHLRAESPQHDEGNAHKAALRILRPLLPIASAPVELRELIASTERLTLDTETHKRLPYGFAATDTPIVLTQSVPRNELDLLATMLYESLDISLTEARQAIVTWPYEQKARLLHEYLQRYPTGKALRSARYEWDICSPLTVVADLPSALRNSIALQALTPRYGYDTPPEVEAAGCSDAYDALFDRSLALHSTLMAQGFAAEAQYATLFGHKQRWLLTLDAQSLLTALTENTAFAQQLRATIAERQPLLAAASFSPHQTA